MSPFPRRWFAFLALAALIAVAGGCGGKDTSPSEPGLEQSEADDLMLVLAGLAAADSGGWMFQIHDSYDHWQSMRPSPALASIGGQAPDAVVDRGHMRWEFTYQYFDTAGMPQASIDLATIRIETIARGSGRIALGNFGGSTGFGGYTHRDTMFVEGLRPTETSLTFSGFVSGFGFATFDTALVSVRSGTSTRYYYLDNQVEFLAVMSKDPSAPRYPTSGTVEVDAFVDFLRNGSHADRIKTVDVSMVLTFDGTATPVASITANTENPTAVFRYLVDLDTGSIVQQR